MPTAKSSSPVRSRSPMQMASWWRRRPSTGTCGSTSRQRPSELDMSRNALLRSQLARRDIWRRAAVERLTEPLHLNLISLGIAVLGGVRAKAAFDLLVRRQHAYGLLKAADEARARGLRELTVVELGVASGAGLLNICELGARIGEETGVAFRVAGFDTGNGMPAPADYRDHPELYKEGWFPMDRDALEGRLPPNAEIHFGPI